MVSEKLEAAGRMRKLADLRLHSVLRRKKNMLWTIAVVLLVLWALGLATSFMGGFIHILLFAAIVIVVMRVFSGRRVA
jgi:Family of unknown function (DUF5670)